jgi:hypothetical protein
MTLLKNLILIAISFSLFGCATKSLDLSVSDKEVFYEPAKDKTLASLYLTCGKMAKDGHYEDSLIENNPTCDFAINGKKYSQISIGQVGRVDIPAGKFTLANSFSVEAAKNLEIKPSEKILLVSDRNEVSKPMYSYMLGFIGSMIYQISIAISPPPKQVLFPLIIYKNDFMNKINMKQPVKVFLIDNK